MCSVGSPARCHSGYPLSSRRALKPRLQEAYGVVGVDAVAGHGSRRRSRGYGGAPRAPRRGRRLGPNGRRRCARRVLGRRPHVDDDDTAPVETFDQLGGGDLLDLVAVAEVGVGEHVDVGDVGAATSRRADHSSATRSLVSR